MPEFYQKDNLGQAVDEYLEFGAVPVNTHIEKDMN